jgi:thiamine-phosphate pyrophosphorylase
MISDPEYSVKEICSALKKHSPDFFCYRNKKYYDEKEIIYLLDFARKYSKFIFINYTSLKTPEILKKTDGIHLPSSKLDLIETYKNKIIIASTHNTDEIKKASKADYITFSPVFDSKNRKGLGVEVLNEICEIHQNVIALGGIKTEKEIQNIKLSKATGFAAIRYFFT